MLVHWIWQQFADMSTLPSLHGSIGGQVRCAHMLNKLIERKEEDLTRLRLLFSRCV